jgi:thiol-disulfide isomerase/thioredoxin
MKLFFCTVTTLLLFTAYPQQAYKTGDVVANVTFPKILNHTTTSSSVNNLKAELTVIDFFGTWCVPCVKALPHLTQLQFAFKNKVAVILVSNETTARLTKFIAARTPFAFPVVVDDDNKFTVLFQPPSYPYTVILDKAGKIISITDAASLNENDINKWLTQKTEPIKTDTAITIKSATIVKNLQSSNTLVQLSQQFIYAAKIGEATDSLVLALKNLPYNSLKNNLQSDEEKKAFWINLYNGFTQLVLTKNPEQYKSRNRFFKSKQINIAGKKFSLDNIEHGILRHSKIKWSLGYFNTWFPGKTEKELRVNEVDYRIHFTLNCGAKSCPPIAFYNPENLNPQMELATKAYLTGEATYDSTKNTVRLPALMNWFRRDFGGKRKMKQLLQEINIIPAGSNPKIKFKKYNWDLFLNHYKTDN